ncbi:hypothetical protein GGI35DRAFT_490775 [Trichoderma velutinum]
MSSSGRSPKDVTLKSYSFVIIGGGTAGLVVAARLTEDPNTSVLVLEAGEDRIDDPKIDTPAMMSQLYEDPVYDWCFKSVPQPALSNRIVAQPRGRVLGGSSAINFMMATYPSAADIDAWGKLGNVGWSWDELLPYYQRSETLHLPSGDDVASSEAAARLGSDIFDSSLYGKDGPLQLSLPFGGGVGDAAWRTTLMTLGLGAEDDPRRGSTLGGYATLKFVDAKRGWIRSYSARAYYEPVKERKNLVVLTGAHVNRILFEGNGESVAASGVEFDVSGRVYVVKADKEIVLSAGTIQSPQILELSGVGSANILKRAGVQVVLDNPNVGENFQDHPIVPIAHEAHDTLQTAETLRQPDVLEWAIGEFQAGRGGPLATGVSGTSFLTYTSILDDPSKAKTLSDRICIPSGSRKLKFEVQKEIFDSTTEADVQIQFMPSGFNPYVGESMSKLFIHTDPGNYLTIAAVLNHPFSRGSIHIVSPNPKEQPAINPNYLANPIDFEMMVDNVLFMQKTAETKPLADLIKNREDGSGKKIQPVYGISKRINREVAMELVMKATISSWHPVGTCSMLPLEQGGVVDHRLRVHGVKSLRIVDASIMPLHIRGNISSSVYAIAERAADFIKEDWQV